jgi:NADPH:quinone reductase
MARVNRQITLAARPVGLPKISDFSLTYAPLRPPGDGEVQVRAVYLSLDPHLRPQMDEAGSGGRTVGLGEVMAGAVVAVVVESRDARFRAGDAVVGMLGWQEFAVVRGRQLRKLDPNGAPISTALGVLGQPGLTAYFGLLRVAQPQAGETLVVSGAAGGVGNVVGQIARMRGCRVVGVAASAVEVAWLRDELGFEGALNYKRADEFERELAALCPDGVDVYFDNVGGETSDAVVRRINHCARIALCGQSSQDNLERPEPGPRWAGELIAKRARAEGFQVADFSRRFAAGRRQLLAWLLGGELRYREHIAKGLEQAPSAFLGVLQGKNLGKQLVQISETMGEVA